MSEMYEDHDLQHRAHPQIPKGDVQAWAERQGVPPSVQPEVQDVPNNDPEVPDSSIATREYHWRWRTMTDPTGATRQIWFADGPRAGTSDMVPFENPFWTVLHYPLGPEGPYERYTYRIEQRDDGLWIGKAVDLSSS